MRNILALFSAQIAFKLLKFAIFLTTDLEFFNKLISNTVTGLDSLLKENTDGNQPLG